MFSEFFKGVTDWYMANLNYGTITLLMTIESSFIPFPSEIVIPPAAYKAAQGDLNIILVVLFSTIGSILGALINYFLAFFLGRPIIYKLAETKIAHMLLITKQNVEKSEQYFIKFGNLSTFIGRLVPGIRQLISIPAGLAKMNMASFLIFTIIGAGIWNIILAVLGYFLYSQKELLELYYKEISYVGLALGIIFIIFVVIKIILSNKKEKKEV
ncbi:MAG TPA: DedA family protein [Spirochaetota bacterium]|nr:DedA family protein [Spirochaetota bacterium]